MKSNLQQLKKIEQEKIKQKTFCTDLLQLRPVLFWDTKISTIDWERHKKAIIKRVFERGDEMEKKEVIRFYGAKTVDTILNNISQNSKYCKYLILVFG